MSSAPHIPSPPSPPTAAMSSAMQAMAIVLLTFLAHGISVFNGFIWDDDAYVYANPTLQSLGGLRDIWLVPAATPQYYPLVHTSFWIENALWGLRPLGYHLDNILLHAGSSVLLWLILRRLAVPGAWLAAAIFAVHPVHVETVSWVTERKNTLSGLFYLLSLYAYLLFSPADRYQTNRQRDWRFYGFSIVLLVAALLSKTVTCTLPASILLIYWWKRSSTECPWTQWAKHETLLLVPFFAIGAVMGIHTAHLEQTHVGATGTEWNGIHWVERCLIAGNAVVFYAYKLIRPTDLAFIYPYPLRIISRARPELFIAPALVVAALAGTFALRNKITKGPFTGLAFSS